MRKSDRRDWLLLVAIAVPCLLLGFAAQAQQCPSFQTFKDGLKAHGEEPGHMSLTAAGTTIVVFVNPDTGSWSIVETRPQDGCSRMPAHGQAWRDIEPEPKGERS